MRAPDITFRAGDRIPEIARTVTVDGVPVNLSSYTASFTAYPVNGTTPAINGAAATVDPDQVTNTGLVTYAPTAPDALLPAGIYLAWFEVVAAGSKTLTVPNDGFLVMEVIGDQSAVWSYTGDPASRPVDAVRYLIQDIDPDNPLQRDAEIEWLLAQRGGNVYYAAADACRSVAGQYSKLAGVSKKVGDLALTYSADGQAGKYTELAASLELRGAMLTMGAPVAGGTNPDTSPAIFSIGMMDPPGDQ